MEKLIKHKDEILRGTATPDIVSRIYSLHIRIFGVHYKKGCNSCYQDCFMKIYSHYKKNGLMNEYQLKVYATGRVEKVVSNDGSLIITNANITSKDESGQLIVEKILKENKGLIGKFSKYPADWEVRCGLISKEETKKEAEEERINEPIITESTIIPGVAATLEYSEVKKRGRKKKA